MRLATTVTIRIAVTFSFRCSFVRIHILSIQHSSMQRMRRFQCQGANRLLRGKEARHYLVHAARIFVFGSRFIPLDPQLSLFWKHLDNSSEPLLPMDSKSSAPQRQPYSQPLHRIDLLPHDFF